MRVTLAAFAVWLAVAAASFTGWVTNLFMLFKHHDTVADLALGIAGVPIVPIGAIRGLGHLFGAW